MKQYKEAFETILMLLNLIRQSDKDEGVNQLKRDFVANRDFAILKSLPGRYKIERTIIEGLQKAKGNDYLGAILSLPRNSRELYAHAYQVLSLKPLELSLEPRRLFEDQAARNPHCGWRFGDQHASG